MKNLSKICLLLLVLQFNVYSTKDSKNAVVDNVYDIKDFKKIIRTKTNVLVCYTSSIKQTAQVIKVFRERQTSSRDRVPWS
jgi:hypothetical protein